MYGSFFTRNKKSFVPKVQENKSNVSIVTKITFDGIEKKSKRLSPIFKSLLFN
jgi:hypothetical protein